MRVRYSFRRVRPWGFRVGVSKGALATLGLVGFLAGCSSQGQSASTSSTTPSSTATQQATSSTTTPQAASSTSAPEALSSTVCQSIDSAVNPSIIGANYTLNANSGPVPSDEVRALNNGQIGAFTGPPYYALDASTVCWWSSYGAGDSYAFRTAILRTEVPVTLNSLKAANFLSGPLMHIQGIGDWAVENGDNPYPPIAMFARGNYCVLVKNDDTASPTELASFLRAVSNYVP